MSLLNGFEPVELVDKLQNGTYTVKVESVKEEYAQTCSKIVVSFSIDGRTDFLPNKIYLTKIIGGNQSLNSRNFFLAITRFLHCFGIDPQTQGINYSYWIGKTGQVEIKDGKNGYKDIVLILPKTKQKELTF